MMLSLVSSGVLALWLETAGVFSPQSRPPSPWLDAPGLVFAAETDNTARSLVQQYLQQLNGQGMSPTRQGIWLQAGMLQLAAHQGTIPRSAASITKAATSLVALNTWDIDRQFVTEIGMRGQLEEGVLNGDLVIVGGGDPLLVWEEAIAIAVALENLGVRRVTGDLILADKPLLNFQGDPAEVGSGFRQAFDSSQWTPEIEKAYGSMPPNTPKPQLTISGNVLATQSRNLGQLPLLRHHSLPLVSILKLMNVHSNNVVAEALADELGGGAVVAERAASLAGVPTEEIQLINGSGLGQENRISPRAACAVFTAIHRRLSVERLNLADVFPIFGRDGGTMAERAMPKGATVKTGTLWNVSALAGVLPTRDRGLVWFAILNGGDSYTLPFRRQQDEFLARLQQTWGVAPLPATLTPSFPAPVLGASDRNQILGNLAASAPSSPRPAN